MTIKAISPSFNGYIKVKECQTSYKYGDVNKFNTQRIFNTNSIAIEENKFNDDPAITFILFQNKQYPCNVDFKTLTDAILKADSNPGKVINVEKGKSVDYEI